MSVRNLRVLRGGDAARPAGYILSPSGFAFLWEECRRCFYLETKKLLRRPRSIMPKVFGVIDDRMKHCFTGSCLDVPGLPSGVLGNPELWVESEPMVPPDTSTSIVIRGRLDNTIAFEDGTYGVIDRKTADVNDDHVPFYTRQLHAYAYALEHPAHGKRRLAPISHLGLVVFHPRDFIYPGEQADGALVGTVNFIEVPRDDAGFISFLTDVAGVLEQPTPPPSGANCSFCNFLTQAAAGGFIAA